MTDEESGMESNMKGGTLIFAANAVLQARYRAPAKESAVDFKTREGHRADGRGFQVMEFGA